MYVLVLASNFPGENPTRIQSCKKQKKRNKYKGTKCMFTNGASVSDIVQAAFPGL